MAQLTSTEIEKLSIMYDGNKNRDASSKIRGFLFQDYIAIMCLLQDDVEYVCSEYIEDVDVFYSNGTFEYIQAKYYPNTYPDKKEISTDLYYQFLQLQMLHSTLKAKPRLFIHRNPEVSAPTIEEMKSYIGFDVKSRKSVTYPDTDDSEKWLRDNIYTKDTKVEQKSALFKKMASEDSIKKFLKELEIIYQVDISTYKDNLMTELAKTYPIPEEDGDEIHWKRFLLGLAISYIQKRYLQDNPTFGSIRVSKEEFTNYIIENTQILTEKAISSYLIGLASDEYGEIISNNELTLLQVNFLNRIYHNTVTWLSVIAESPDGQYKLINTLSKEGPDTVAQYRNLSLNKRKSKITEIRDSFIIFVEYLWKIMINICQEKISGEEEIESNLELFDPCSYIDEDIQEYVCFNFPDDRYASHTVILSGAQNFRRDTVKIVRRMITASTRPEKWMFKNSNIVHGKNYYDYSTANVAEEPTVADLGRAYFYIECMDCIGVDYGQWGIAEKCGDCIFIDKCVKEGH